MALPIDCPHDEVTRHQLQNHDGSPYLWWQCENCEELFVTITTHLKLTGDALKVIESMMPYAYHMAGVDWGLINDTLLELRRVQPPETA